jgi:trehalose-6-phosphate synthase
VDEEDRPYIQKRLREEFNAVVIFVDDKLKRKWVSFCKNSLWPLFNSQLSTNNFANEEWQAYKRCNEIYAAKVKELAAGREEETAVWVHDYHLFVLPQST